MAFEALVTVPLNSDGTGAVTAHSGLLQAKLKKVRYVHAASGTMTGTPSLSLTGTTTGTTFLAVAAITGGGTDQEWVPQQLSNKNSDGTATTNYTDIAVAEDITVAMANAGANKSGTLYLTVGD